jgi:hypothetical protein
MVEVKVKISEYLNATLIEEIENELESLDRQMEKTQAGKIE